MLIGGRGVIDAGTARPCAALDEFLADAGIPPDYASLGRMAFRHAQLRALPTLQPVLRTIPSVAIWDDHDYGDAN